MHRDIKPTNVIFKNKDSIEGLKITDFHLAIPIDPNIDLRVCGTPGYAAPEKFNEVYNEKVDIFSIGCIFFKL
jgi:serine/threonine protein kinase